jgi:hypothetical protein
MSSAQLKPALPSSTVDAGEVDYCCKVSARAYRYMKELVHQEVVTRPLPGPCPMIRKLFTDVKGFVFDNCCVIPVP